MKKFLLLFILPLYAFSQNQIEISEDYSTVLIFPSPIETHILGNEQEYFIKPSNNSNLSIYTLIIGYIKIDRVQKDTNLIVFTKDGNSYSFNLKYAQQPSKIDPYYINLDQRSNTKSNTKTITASTSTNVVKVKDSYYSKGVVTSENKKINPNNAIIKTEDLYQADKLAYIEKYCEDFNDTEKRIFKMHDKSSNIKFMLKDISFNKDELYFHLQINNDGGQTFDVDFINTKLARDYKGTSTDQSIPLTPLFIYNRPSRIKGKSQVHFTMVFKKFTINDKKEVQIDLAEKEGERDLLLKIDNKIVNNPQRL